MTWFCTLNIPTMFGVQFLSFVVNMAEKCFDRFLTTLSGPSTTRAAIVENQAQITRFCTRNKPALFLVNTPDKCFGIILTTFLGLITTIAGPK